MILVEHGGTAKQSCKHSNAWPTRVMQMQSNLHCTALLVLYCSLVCTESIPLCKKCKKELCYINTSIDTTQTCKGKWLCVCAYSRPVSSCHFRLNGWLIWLTLSHLQWKSIAHQSRSPSTASRLQPSSLRCASCKSHVLRHRLLEANGFAQLALGATKGRSWHLRSYTVNVNVIPSFRSWNQVMKN